MPRGQCGRWGRGGRLFAAVVFGALAFTFVGNRPAQAQEIQLQVTRNDLGVNGVFRAGSWTPLRVTVNNGSKLDRRVIVEWELMDVDGDLVQMQREMTLSPNFVSSTWLYGQPRMNLISGLDGVASIRWKVRLYDKNSGALLAQQNLSGSDLSDVKYPHQSIIAVTGTAPGLSSFATEHTQHEPITFAAGFAPRVMPDRWYGLQMCSAIIWTGAGGPPNDPKIRDSHRRALREWVLRGGHLVISMPQVGNRWLDSDLPQDLRGMLPPIEKPTPVTAPRPMSLGRPPFGVVEQRVPELEYAVLTPQPGSEVAVVLRDDAKRPIGVTHQVGLGRVTLLGIDVTNLELRKKQLPSGASGFWQSVFNWRSPGFSRATIDAGVKAGKIARVGPGNRVYDSLDKFVPDRIAMRETAAPALMAAILVFGLYWLLAGPVSYGVLKAKGIARHSWLVFAAIVAVFSLIAWGGAYMIRPQTTRIEHFSLVRVDAQGHHYHVRSHLSLFDARHSRMDLALGATDEEDDETAVTQQGYYNLVSSPGDNPRRPQLSHLNPQPYVVSASKPSEVRVPMRATAKSFEVDFFERASPNAINQKSLFTSQWIMPQGEVKLAENGWFDTSQLIHGLPVALRDVWWVYRRHDGRVFAWEAGDWEPNAPHKLPAGAPRVSTIELVQKKTRVDRNGNVLTTWDGVLPKWMGSAAGRADDDIQTGTKVRQVQVSRLDVVRKSQVLSFFGNMPPPKFTGSGFQGPRNYLRSLGRTMDLTPMLSMPRLIMIGHIENSEIPLPLTVDGDRPVSKGWTVVQWIQALPAQPVGAAPPPPADPDPDDAQGDQ